MVNETTEILKFLISNREETFSIRKIALRRKINYKSAYNAIKILEKEGVVGLKRVGNSISCSFNDNFNDLVFKAEYLRREDLFKKKDFQLIYNSLAELQFPFIAILFGSQVKGTANKHSDTDLLVICDENKAHEINKKIRLFSFKIHLTDVNSESFIRMLKSKEFSVVSEAIKKNIILIGIEDYYRLVNNAK